jgi:hypothetical protein
MDPIWTTILDPYWIHIEPYCVHISHIRAILAIAKIHIGTLSILVHPKPYWNHIGSTNMVSIWTNKESNMAQYGQQYGRIRNPIWLNMDSNMANQYGSIWLKMDINMAQNESNTVQNGHQFI